MAYDGDPALAPGPGLIADVHLDGLFVDGVVMTIQPTQEQNELYITGARSTEARIKKLESPFQFNQRDVTSECV